MKRGKERGRYEERGRNGRCQSVGDMVREETRGKRETNKVGEDRRKVKKIKIQGQIY